jgi:ribulose-5-phosphate 4-epimerase/fuculose-1-phosphate aldolase
MPPSGATVLPPGASIEARHSFAGVRRGYGGLGAFEAPSSPSAIHARSRAIRARDARRHEARMNSINRRRFLSMAAMAAMLFRSRNALAQAGPASAGPADPKLIEDLVAANHILVDQGVVDGYGHVSVRHDRDANRYLMSRSIAPELVTATDIMEYDLDSNAVDPKGRTTYLERFIHGEIYKVRPDVKAIVHNHSPSVIPFGVTGAELKPLYHMSAFLGGGVPVFDIRAATGQDTDMLVRNPAIGKALAAKLGAAPVALMRGHGAVVVGAALPQAVFRSVYTEVNAKLQAQAMALGGGNVTYLDADEAKKAEASVGGTIARPWELWKKKALGGR